MKFLTYFKRNQDTSAPTTKPDPAPSTTTPLAASLWAHKLPIGLAALLVLATGSAVYFHSQVLDLQKNPNEAALEESRATIEAVGRLIVLPENEQPTIATVSDPSKLKDQPFFASAKIGDKVLIYTNAKKAILYSPTENKIVEVAPVNIGAGEAQVSGAATKK